jgi:SAM-dependent methyltransferase
MRNPCTPALTFVAFAVSCAQPSPGGGPGTAEPEARARLSVQPSASVVSSAAVPYVPSSDEAVRAMMWIASVGHDDVVYDLGSGDGRVVIAAVRDFGARRAVGIENDAELVARSRELAQRAGVADRVQFVQQDLFAAEVGDATVVTLYLGRAENMRLRPLLLRALKPGTRIVSHRFGMGEWRPDRELSMRAPELPRMCGTLGRPDDDVLDNTPEVPGYATGTDRGCAPGDRVLLWVVPAGVAGLWRGEVQTTGGAAELILRLHQKLSGVTGSCQLSSEGEEPASARIWLAGTEVQAACEDAHLHFTLELRGRVEGNALDGSLSLREQHGEPAVHRWQGRRPDQTLAGSWALPQGLPARAARLRIEGVHGQRRATYSASNAELVDDFYDWGGGFYFTLAVGPDRPNRASASGSLIGEAILEAGSLRGTLELYALDGHPRPAPRGGVLPTSRDWAAASAP